MIFIVALIFGFLSGYGIIAELGIENLFLRFIVYGITGTLSFLIIGKFYTSKNEDKNHDSE